MAGFEGDRGPASVAKGVGSVCFEDERASVAENEPDPHPVPRDSKRISHPKSPSFLSAFGCLSWYACFIGVSRD
jgi:hypothetical protein